MEGSNGVAAIARDVYKKLMKFKNDPRALCIGNFDGVHRGHRALLDAALGLSPHVVVLTFDPHPRRVFQPDAPPFLINSPAHKNRLLRHYGVTEIITWPFSADLAAVPADLFIEHVIIKQTQANHVIVGADFQFGKNREGTVETLQAWADKGKFTLTIVPFANEGGEKISSTAIRTALAEGDIASANKELGWNYAIEEMVVKGDQRGREIGFPTANQRISAGCMLPQFGIYASVVALEGKRHMACTSIGMRPMFAVTEPIIETHILDWDGDLYGKTLHVEPFMRLRGEEKYNSLEALVAQIGEDCIQARGLLTSRL